MADLSYSIGIDTGQAQRNLDNLKRTLAGIGTAIAGAFVARELVTVAARFEDLRITLQILYRSVGAGARAFNDIKEFAKTSAFAVEDLVQTVIKLKTAGIEPNIALLRLFADVSGSVADRLGALQAITDLYARTTAGGLGLEDLNRLADRGIPVFSILQEKLGANRLELSKIGQSAEGAQLILRALEAGLAETFAGGSAAKAGSLNQALSNLGDTVNNLIDLLGTMGATKALAQLINAFGQVIESLKPFVAIVGVALADAFSILADVFKILAENIRLVVLGLTAMLTVFSVSVIVRLAQGVLLLTTAFGALGKTPVIKTLTVIAGLLTGVAAALKIDIGGAATDAKDKLDEVDQALRELEKGGQLSIGQLATDTGNLKSQLQGLYTATSQYRIELENSVVAYARQNSELVKRLEFERDLIGASEQQRTIRQALFDLENSYLSEVARLTDEYRKKSQSKSQEDQAQLPLIQEALRRVTEEYQSQIEVVKQLTSENYLLQEAEKRRIDISEFAIKTQLDGNRELRKLQDDMAKIGMTEIEKKYYDIARASEESARAQIEQENARRRSLKLAEMTASEEAAYFEAAKTRNQELVTRTGELYQKSREFSTGWTSAFQQYLDEATNGAKAAENIFRKATQGMEDAIVNFAKTGKLEWKNFVLSMAEELLRSQVRQLLAQLFTTQSGGSGGNFFAKMLGFANGGVIPTNKPVLVGERGPEIITGAAGRTVIPNEALGMAGSVTYYINAVDAASFKSLIARDPGFIHAVAQQGAKLTPARR